MSKVEELPQSKPAIIIPDGYIKKANGDIVPRHKIKEQDWLRDEVARNIGETAEVVSQSIIHLKKEAGNELEDLVSIAADKYGVELGGKLGNLTVKTVDGQYKVTRKISNNITFTEEIHAAKAMIDECVIRWSNGSEKNLITAVNNTFKTNQKGHLIKEKIFEMLRWNIEDDDEWDNAMKAVSDSILNDSTTTYINVYKLDNDDKYQPIPLSISGV